MARYILHLSDLHLAPRGDSEEVGDFRKANVLGSEEKWVKTDVIRANLAALSRRLHETDEIEALVISGDITEHNRPDGYDLLESVLDELGEHRPRPEQTVVVPGNHDVLWQRSPFEEEAAERRYENFRTYVRARRYVTPLLRGIDYSAEGDLPSAAGHLAEASDGRWLIVPVNSSHFCGRAIRLTPGQRRAWEQAAHALGVPVGEVGETLGLPSAFDIARVDPQQLALLSRFLTEHSARAAGRPCIRIMVLHHQLQPVSEAEEFKPFESLSDLGNVRRFLREQSFDLVLHGHKHASAVYFDHIYDLDKLEGSRAQQVLVVASPAPAANGREPIFRLIRVGDEPRSGFLGITDVPRTAPGGVLTLPAEKSLQIWRAPTLSEPFPPTLIDGDDLDTTYARIQGLFAGLAPSAHVPLLICRTAAPAGGAKYGPPHGYPPIPGVEDVNVWFSDMVRWWQQPVSRLDDPSYFTHGSRLRRYGPGQVNQVDQAVQALRSDRKSTRAVITLLTPTSAPARPGGFPSFCQLHLVIREAAAGVPELEAIAYFRKQEMRYWWAINMAEIREVQLAVFERLSSDRLAGLRLGPITTISAVALCSDAPPRVHVPAVDRFLDEDPQLLSRMATALFWLEMPGRLDLAHRWDDVLTELVPPSRWNEDGVPIATSGLAYLTAALAPLAREAPTSGGALVAALLGQIHDENTRYQVSTTQEEDHSAWHARVAGVVRQAQEWIPRLFPPVSTPPST